MWNFTSVFSVCGQSAGLTLDFRGAGFRQARHKSTSIKKAQRRVRPGCHPLGAPRFRVHFTTLLQSIIAMRQPRNSGSKALRSWRDLERGLTVRGNSTSVIRTITSSNFFRALIRKRQENGCRRLPLVAALVTPTGKRISEATTVLVGTGRGDCCFNRYGNHAHWSLVSDCAELLYLQACPLC